MSNLTNLKSAWTTAISTAVTAGDLSAIDSYEALAALDVWIAAETALGNSLATETTSYSIDGRSVTKAGHGNLIAAVNEARTRFKEILYGNVTLADMSGADESIWENLR